MYMKKFFSAIGFIVSVTIQSQELNVMTFNIRYNTKNDSLNAWPYRKDNAACCRCINTRSRTFKQIYYILYTAPYRIKNFEDEADV